MRLYEIQQNITEAINFTRYIDDAENAMKKGIIKACAELPKVTITPEMQADIDETATLRSVKEALDFPELVKQYCADELKKLAVNKMKVPLSDVIFEQLEDANGEAYGLEVRLNIAYINGIVKPIWAKWIYEIGSNSAKPINYTKTAKKVINRFTKNLSTIKMPILENCASTFIHEMVHAQQHAAQATKGISADNTDYRSYIKTPEVPNKEAFKAMVDTPGALDDPENYRIFRASPQEMTAFANQAAAKFIKDNKLNLPGAKADSATMAKLQNYLGDYFRDRDNYQEHTLLKRYGTLVYKAVADYLNRNAEQAKQNTR